jgi:hypothetical protein
VPGEEGDEDDGDEDSGGDGDSGPVVGTVVPRSRDTIPARPGVPAIRPHTITIGHVTLPLTIM